MLKAWIYNKGGCTDTIFFDPLAVESFIEATYREYPFDSTILMTMKTGVQHLIANRDSVGDAIYNAQRDRP